MQVVKNNGRCSILVYAGNIHAAKQKKKFPLLLCSLLCMDSPELFGDQISRSRSRDSSYLPKSPIIYLVFSLPWTDLTSPRVS